MPEIDLKQYLLFLWRWLWLIGIASTTAAGAGYRVASELPKTYVSSATLMVGETPTSPNVTAEQLQTAQRLTQAYVDLARRQPVLDGTVKALGLSYPWYTLSDQVLVIADGLQFIDIHVMDTNPQRAKAIADDIARQLIQQSPTAQNERQLQQRQAFVQKQLDDLQVNIQEAQKTRAEKQAQLDQETSARRVLELQDEIKALDDKLTSWQTTYASLLSMHDVKPPNTLTLIEPASVPNTPTGPSVRSIIALSAVAGGLLAIAAALIIEYFNDVLATPDQVARALSFTSLGQIARMPKQRKGNEKEVGISLLTVQEPNSPVSETYRMLRTNVRLQFGDSPVILLVTSPATQEGKSTTSANLAVSFAQIGKRTILVDSDLRAPSIHTLFHVDGDAGLTSLLTDDLPGSHYPGERHPTLEDLKHRLELSLRQTAIPGLLVLPAGPMVNPNPGELLASPNMEVLLKILKSMADVVIFDSPPINGVADGLILAAKGVDVLLVVRLGKTQKKAANLAEVALTKAHVHVVGVVINAAPTTATGYRYRQPTATGVSKSEDPARAVS
jgi:Mrp family chromosome partitioning ATPase/capsular polysaccharide biosynthesis protein